MLLWQPNYLVDVGFQLSFFATLGILLGKPILDALLSKWGITGGITDDVSTTMAAQIGTLPILLGVFGNVSLISLLVNSLILWTVPFLMTFGSIAVVAGFLFEPLGQLIALLCLPFLWYFELVVNVFGEIGGIWEIDSFPWPYIACYYLMVLSLVFLFQRTKEGEEY